MGKSRKKIYTAQIEKVRVYAYRIRCPKCGREFTALHEMQAKAQFISHAQKCFDMEGDSWQIIRKQDQR